MAGAVFLGFAFVAVIIAVVAPDSPLWLLVALIMGAASGIFSLYDIRRTQRLRRLKESGIPHDAKIINLVSQRRPAPAFVRVGPFSSTYVECRFLDEYGRERYAKSHLFLWDSPVYSGLSAKVYVDREDPGKYAVEIFEATNSM